MDLEIGRILLVLMLAFAFLVYEVRRIYKASILRRQFATAARELQREREELVAAQAEAQSANDLCISYLSKARGECQELTSKMQERQARDQETIALLKERLGMMEARAVLAESQNRSLTKKYTKYKASAISMQKTIQTLSKSNEKRDKLLSDAEEAVTQHAATISTLNARNAELETTVISSNIQIVQSKKEADDWKFLFLSEVGSASMIRHGLRSSSSSSTPSMATMLAERDQRIEELKDRLAECHSRLAACSCGGDS
ncbi:hypothetical protein H1R20_g1755, partial [Candolleomyces eurysporus]